jgi:hypothetical protein
MGAEEKNILEKVRIYRKILRMVTAIAKEEVRKKKEKIR